MRLNGLRVQARACIIMSLINVLGRARARSILFVHWMEASNYFILVKKDDFGVLSFCGARSQLNRYIYVVAPNEPTPTSSTQSIINICGCKN